MALNSKLAYTLMSMAAFGMIASVLYFIFILKQEQTEVSAEFRESLIWHAGQLLHETNKFYEQLTDYHYGNSDILREDVELQFDVLWSRILTLSNGYVGQAYLAAPGGQEARIYGHEMLEEIEQLMHEYQPGDQARYDIMRSALIKAQNLFHQAMLAATHVDQQAAVQRRERFTALFHQSIYILAFTLGCALILVAILLRDQFALHDLRKNLENRVEKRTMQLASSNRSLQIEMQERSRAEDELRKLSAAVEQSPVAVAILERDGKLSYVNAKFVLQAGIYARDVIGKSIVSLDIINFNGDDGKAFSEAIQKGEAWRGEYQICNQHGDEFWVETNLSPVRARDGVITHFILLEEDVSLRKHHEKRLRRQAFYDEITRLPNRVLALDRLAQAIASAQRHNHRAALMFIDLDQFKRLNDTLGHAAGDQLLRFAGERFSGCLREEDTVARLGGDEFMIVLPHIEISQNAERVAKKIIDAFMQPFLISGQEVFTSTSIGIALYPDDAKDPLTLMRNADAAMYQVKDSGRNNFRFFTQSMDDHVKQRLRLETHLRRALERDEFVLHYQPIIEIASGRVIGAEALLRWQNSALGELVPDQFIGLAEETGLIVAIGEWVLRTACQAAVRWNRLCPYDFRIAVNVSSRQFKDATLLQAVNDTLKQSGLPKRCLDIEVTESLMLDSSSDIVATLNDLSGIGVQLAIDDFGTGYSSLSYVKKYPFTKLKIDRSFINGVIDNSEDAALARAILAMAQSLNLEVVGEGVETATQLDFLHRHHCTYAQGFYFSRPLVADEFEVYLLSHLQKPGIDLDQSSSSV